MSLGNASDMEKAVIGSMISQNQQTNLNASLSTSTTSSPTWRNHSNSFLFHGTVNSSVGNIDPQSGLTNLIPWRQKCCGGITCHGTINCRASETGGGWHCFCKVPPSLNYPLLFRLGQLVQTHKVHTAKKKVESWDSFSADILFKDEMFRQYQAKRGSALLTQFEKGLEDVALRHNLSVHSTDFTGKPGDTPFDILYKRLFGDMVDSTKYKRAMQKKYKLSMILSKSASIDQVQQQISPDAMKLSEYINSLSQSGSNHSLDVNDDSRAIVLLNKSSNDVNMNDATLSHDSSESLSEDVEEQEDEGDDGHESRSETLHRRYSKSIPRSESVRLINTSAQEDQNLALTYQQNEEMSVGNKRKRVDTAEVGDFDHSNITKQDLHLFKSALKSFQASNHVELQMQKLKVKELQLKYKIVRQKTKMLALKALMNNFSGSGISSNTSNTLNISRELSYAQRQVIQSALQSDDSDDEQQSSDNHSRSHNRGLHG